MAEALRCCYKYQAREASCQISLAILVVIFCYDFLLDIAILCTTRSIEERACHSNSCDLRSTQYHGDLIKKPFPNQCTSVDLSSSKSDERFNFLDWSPTQVGFARFPPTCLLATHPGFSFGFCFGFSG